MEKNFALVRDLLYFTQIVANRTFSDAAKQLQTSRSSLSRFIQELEETLGYELISPSSTGIALTDIGQLVYQKFQPFLKQGEEELEDLFTSKQDYRGEVRILAPGTIFNFWNSNKIIEFKKHFPKINLQLEVGTGFNISDSAAYNYDLIFSGELPNSNNFYITKMGIAKSSLYCNQKYVDNFGLPQSIYELQTTHKERVLSIRPNPIIAIHEITKEAHTIISKPSFAAMGFAPAQFIESGIFIYEVVHPKYAVMKDWIPVLPEYYINEFPMYLLHSVHAKSSAVTAVKQFLMKLNFE